ncbi:ATP-binding cassette domain-containing protein [Chitinophagaceae bacterium LB-8]|uniref:ATP-binding cassette domain-containing protein n=1 Tax=Paraflavisolibacter caeni TaxID=2982496 RepID=A0A9X2XU97_9BACT|nr:ATP-binding cassette domain-containing protein [Paraflavisolibacter caeni]MCU7549349.1 ATP-binding cassette domain-containing protein [Paraflavisolibacter caeni]
MTMIKAVELSVKLGSRCVINPVSFEVNEHEQWAVVGPSGSGKTTLLHALAGLQFHSGRIEMEKGIRVVMVEQQHKFKNLSNTSNFYYQQRFNSFDAEDTITVKEYLQPYVPFREELTSLLDLLGINNLWNRRLIQLSNGENKRLQLAKALLQQPGILLLDNPFTGLDVTARSSLEHILHKVAQHGIHIIIVTAQNAVPSFITNILVLNEQGNAKLYTAQEYNSLPQQEKQPVQIDIVLLQKLAGMDKVHEFENAVYMKNVRVQYGAKEILKNVSWQVKEGERWALSGPNGAGKSTLLSLITGDNPQAYANEIYLFDRKRGSGESIWDIKKRIGYVSTELHLYFPPSISVFKAIASGLFDTIGLFRQLNEAQISRVSEWIRLFGLQHISNRLLSHLSASEQRLTLLARALVKNPSLLILDEPAQGLDVEQARMFKAIVDQICTLTNKTLIYVTHLEEEIPACVNRFIRLEGN